MNERDSIAYSELATDTLLARTLDEKSEFYAPVTHTDPVLKTLSLAGISLLQRQDTNGFWQFVLEADVTIPAEYIMLQHFMGTVDHDKEERLTDYILSKQLGDGSWPLYEGGPGNISATVKAYLALKLKGEDANSAFMQKARKWVLEHGGAENVNVFTRITLATFGQLPWQTIPAMLAEIILLPKWWIFNLSKVSYWSRCVIIPLLIRSSSVPARTTASC